MKLKNGLFGAFAVTSSLKTHAICVSLGHKHSQNKVMGAAQSSADPRHVRIWNNLSSLDSATARMQMIDTLLAGPEYVAIAKRVGIYAALLSWKAATQRGEFYPWPQPSAAPQQQQAPRPQVVQQQQNQLAVLPSGRRDLDALHEAYAVLSIDETQPLTLDALKAYYKRAALKAHPDKGGSPQAFDRAKRAYAYLEEILLKLNPKTQTQQPLSVPPQQLPLAQQQIMPVSAPVKSPFEDVRLTAPVTMDAALRAREMLQQRNQIDMPPSNTPAVSLNPKKLDMATFNKVFEENRMQDPDADGYGDWLKSNATTQSQENKALRDKFNASNFNKAFEDGARQSGQQRNDMFGPQELTLAPSMGVELGRDRPAQYTVPSGEGNIGYTDLKYAYGEGSTFSQQVADVAVSNRTFDAMKREREAAPVALNPQELAAVEAARRARDAAEEARQRRAAAYDADAANYEARIKGRVQIK